jgi:hypothetical protein
VFYASLYWKDEQDGVIRSHADQLRLESDSGGTATFTRIAFPADTITVTH